MTKMLTNPNPKQMLWNWYTIDSCFLAESWHVGSNGAFAASCIGTILLVIILEALRRVGKEYDEWILRGFRARAAQARLGLSPSSPQPASSSSSSATGKQTTTAKVTPASAAWKRLGAAGTGAGAGAGVGSGRAVVFRASPLQQVLRAVIHAAALGLAYIVMLLVMSYNGYIIICVIIGGGLGKFFCDWMTRQYIIDGDGVGGEEEGAAGIEEPSICCS